MLFSSKEVIHMTAKSTMTRVLVTTIILAMIVAFTPVITNSDTYAASKKKVKVTFNANGGKIGKATKKVKKITKNKKVGKLPKATYTGYTFKGWYTKKSGGKKVKKTTKAKKKVTYYAHWSAKEYTVNFDANGGETPTVKSKKVKYKAKYGTMPSTKRAGYKLKGWYKAKSGGSQVTPTTTNTVAATDTLYAQWTEVPKPPEPEPWDGVSDGNYYSVSVGDNVTIAGSEEPMGLCADGKTMGYLSGTYVIVHHPEIAPDGKTFAGWLLADPSSGEISFCTMPVTEVTIGCKNVYIYAVCY